MVLYFIINSYIMSSIEIKRKSSADAFCHMYQFLTIADVLHSVYSALPSSVLSLQPEKHFFSISAVQVCWREPLSVFIYIEIHHFAFIFEA